MYSVPNPVNPQDVATKEYADRVGKKVKESLSQERKHLIVTHAKYCGLLKGGKYQFKFSGGNFETCEENIEKYGVLKGSTTRFLMPHSGAIKKVMAECVGFLDLNDLFETITKGVVGDELEKVKKAFEENEKNIKKNPTRFFTKDKYTKFFLRIVKFEKKLNEDDYPQPYYNPPKIIYSILIDEFKGVTVDYVADKLKIGQIIRIINNQDDRRLSEGDVINIETIKFEDHLINLNLNDPDLNKLKDVLFNAFLRKFSYNFTFLIELDPL